MIALLLVTIITIFLLAFPKIEKAISAYDQKQLSGTNPTKEDTTAEASAFTLGYLITSLFN